MADEADRAQAQEEWTRDAMIHSARSTPFVPGEPGECERCGEDMPRLVGGLCAPCRDGRNRFAPPRRTTNA
jgi:hypothetical protein